METASCDSNIHGTMVVQGLFGWCVEISYLTDGLRFVIEENYLLSLLIPVQFITKLKSDVCKSQQALEQLFVR